jgi:hypothetical protein
MPHRSPVGLSTGIIIREKIPCVKKCLLSTGTRDGFPGTLKQKMKQKKLDKPDVNNYNYYEKMLGSISETI